MTADLFRERRTAATQLMGDGVLVLFAAPVCTRNNDVEHEYRQHSDFYYLSGLDEPEAVLVLVAGEEPAYHLFLRPRNPERETWDGPRVGIDGAKTLLNADHAHPISELSERLPALLKGQRQVFYRLGEHEAIDRQFVAALGRSRALTRRGGISPNQIVDIANVVHELRLTKSEAELVLMRRAAEITREAHLAAMAAAAPGGFEYEVEATLREVFRRRGSERCAYQPIVGSGPNATILHYVKNNRRMQAGDLLLIDAGCEYEYYAADVTRTFPVSGHFSQPQREIYEIVLEAQELAIAATKPGVTLGEVHQVALNAIVDGIVSLGLVSGTAQEVLEKKLYQPFFMHRTGHFLGMDVHDVGRAYNGDSERPLEVGMVTTVEPGIYIATDNEHVPERYRGIGVRIEDDIAVTNEGCVNLSASIPKTVAEVEAACRPLSR